MKRYFKAAPFVAAVVAFALLAVACGRSSLAGQAEAAGKRCPVPIEGVGYITSIAMDGDTLAYVCSVTNTEINLDLLSQRNAEVKRLLGYSLPGLFADDPDLAASLVAKGAWLRIEYRSADGAAPLLVRFTPQELKALLSPEAGAPEADAERRLADEIAVSRAHLPAPMAEGMTMVGIRDDGHNVVFDCVVDEKVAGPEALRQMTDMASTIRAEMLETLDAGARTDHDVMTLREVCLGARRGLSYVYRGTLSGDSLVIHFSLDDLVDPLSEESQQ